jgi:hypothetical protein
LVVQGVELELRWLRIMNTNLMMTMGGDSWVIDNALAYGLDAYREMNLKVNSIRLN